MKKINISGESNDNIMVTVFPDGQPHVRLFNVVEGDSVSVDCSLYDTSQIIKLLQVANAIDNLYAVKEELHIPYLMGARYDRSMNEGDSIDIKIFAELINSCGFKKVFLYDVHSDVSTSLIKNGINVSNESLVKRYNKENAILICPDTGAAKKISKYMKWNTNLSDVIYSIKERDVTTGDLTLKILDINKCHDNNCIIIDDLCDGGATFIGIAKYLKDNGVVPKHFTLMVSHGIFSKGFDTLADYFNDIITTDSYKEMKNENPNLNLIVYNINR